MNEIETLKALLKEANEKIEVLEKALEYANRVNRRLEEREHFLMEERERD